MNDGLTITFRITVNSFYSGNNSTVHPGIDIYLMNNTMEASRLFSELQNPVTLVNKKAKRIAFSKEYRSDLTRINCGVYWGQAEPVDREASRTSSTLPTCLIQQIINYCGCAPVFTSFMSLDTNRYSQLTQQLNQTAACSVSTYESCAKKFLFYATPENWDNPIRTSEPTQVQESVNQCRRNSHTPCQLIQFPGDIVETDLPAEYTTTSDYVSQLTIVYNSYMAYSVVQSRNPNFYQLLSNIGYNIALWFAVGHIIWTLVTTPCNWCCGEPNPKSSKISPLHNGGYVNPSPKKVQNPDTTSLRPPAVDVQPDVARPPDEENPS